jgi:hypothetical protein
VKAAILTFPGHFFQTQLTITSLLEHYPETSHISFVLDDVDCDTWLNYVSDFEASIKDITKCLYNIYLVSEIVSVRQCIAGWWRQQLVKLTLDQLLPGDCWFAIDGDTIFVTRCEIFYRIPISRRNDIGSRFTQMSDRYVRELLGTKSGQLRDHEPVCTNAVPFRYLDKNLLRGLRDHVEKRFNKEFVRLHLDWFQDQTIVADWDPPVRMTMSEWELIECYRRYVLGIDLPFQDIGSGYPLDTDVSQLAQKENIFVHAYRWDTEIGTAWFEDQGLIIDSDVWSRALDWYAHQSRSR